MFNAHLPLDKSCHAIFLSLFKLLALVVGCILAKQFCYSKTSGFAVSKICSNLPYRQEWEVDPLTPEEKANALKALEQPFHFLAKGAQSYAFVSEDGQFVVKFFRIHHLRPPFWISRFTFPLSLMSYKIQKMLAKDEELFTDFMSYKLAYEKLKEETGLIMLHLNKTADLQQKIKIIDRLEIVHELDLDKMEFLLQKKGSLVYPSIQEIVEREGLEKAKESISKLVELLVVRRKKRTV